MINKVLVCLFISLAASAGSDPFGAIKLSPIPKFPTYVCQTKGNKIVIKLSPPVKIGGKVGIWQTDSDSSLSDKGIKFTDAKISAIARCPGCFDFTGTLVLGGDAKMNAELNLRSHKLTLKYPSQNFTQELDCERGDIRPNPRDQDPSSVK